MQVPSLLVLRRSSAYPRLGQEPVSVVRRLLLWRHIVVRKLSEPTLSGIVICIVAMIEQHIFFASGTDRVDVPLPLPISRHINHLFPEGMKPEMAVQLADRKSVV